jgi:hypothetical protein
VPGLLTGPDLRPAGTLLGMAGAAGAVRDTGTGRSPRLRAAAAHRADAWIGGGAGRPGGAGTRVDRPRQPKLRLRGGVAGSAATGQPPRRSSRLAPPVSLRLGAPRRRDGMIAGRRGLTGAVLGAAFGDGRSPAKLRGSALSGGPSAFTGTGQAKRRTPRLKLGSRRHRDAVVGGGRLGSGAWSGASSRGAKVGRGTFGGAATPGMARNRSTAFAARRQPGAPGALRSGRGAGATPKFRRPGTRLRRSGGKLGGAAPKFRRSRTLRRSTGGFGAATPQFRRSGSRLRGSRRGVMSWLPSGRRKGGLR